MPAAPVPIRFTLTRSHAPVTPDGRTLALEEGTFFVGWVEASRMPGSPEDTPVDGAPESFHFFFYFLEASGDAWTSRVELSQRDLRPRPADSVQVGRPTSPELYGLPLFDTFDGLEPWPAIFRPRSKIPSHITGFSYKLFIDDANLDVELSVAYQYAWYRRSLEDVLFLPASRYHADSDGRFLSRDEHSEDVLWLRPATPEALSRIVATNDPGLIRAAFHLNRDWIDRPLPIRGTTQTTLPLIFHVVQSDRPDLVTAAVELGANPSLRLDSPVGTALHLAVTRQRPEIVRMLLAAGADPNLSDAKGETPLHRAAKAGREDLCEILRTGGAREVPDASTGFTPEQMSRLRGFHAAVARGAVDEVGSLLAQESAARKRWLVDASLDGKSALLIAAQAGHRSVLELVAELAEDINRLVGRNEGLRWNALHCAIAYRQLEAVGVLLAHGAHPNAERPATEVAGASLPGGVRPLHIAAEVNSRRIARLLIGRGAAVDAQNDAGETALIIAAKHRYGRKLVELLLESGADLSLTDQSGMSAVAWARKWRHDRVAEVLTPRS